MPQKLVTLDENTYEAKVGSKAVILTGKEFDFIVELRNARRVMSRDELLDKVWSISQTDPRTVDVYVARLRRKIKAPVIRTVKGKGYLYTGR